MTKKEQCLKIIDKWLKNAKTKQQQVDFFMIEDFIYGELSYIKTNEAISKMSEYLENGNQDNEELIMIRRYLCL